MARLDDLQAQTTPQDAPDVDMANMPDEPTGGKPSPYPGRYAFALPADFNFDIVKVKKKKDDGSEYETKRLAVIFDDGHPLTIVETIPSNESFLFTTMNYKITNNEYPLGDEGKKASELGFLLKNCFGEILPTGADNMAYGRALAKHANGKFRVDVEWSAWCSTDRKKFVWDETQGKNVEHPSEMGCGQRWAQRSYTKRDGDTVMQIRTQIVDVGGQNVERFAENFVCVCNASLRCFPRLRNYGPFEG